MTQIELVGGYTDNKGNTHRKVTFGKRITAKDLFKLDTDPQAQDITQYSDLIMSAAITEFGALKMPVLLPVLLSLDSIDRDDLVEAHDKFLNESRGENEAKILPDNKIKLAFGFKIDSVTYDVVQFGKRTNGFDVVNAQKLGFQGVKRECFFIAKQISQLSSSSVEATLETIEIKDFEQLDGYDLIHLRIAAEIWRQSFRILRSGLPEKRIGETNSFIDEGNKTERSNDSELVN